MTRARKDKTKIFILILMACVFCVCLVGLNAYSSELQYDINSINNRIQESNWKIRDLEVSLKTKTNITNLEARALEIGMAYPSFNEIVYLRGDTPDVQDFALALRENIYR